MGDVSDHAYLAKLTHDHWNYVKGVLKVHGEDDAIITLVGHHYLTAFIHGYKHGAEDATDNLIKKLAARESTKNRAS